MQSVVDDHPHWALILGRLKAGEMPPEAVPQPPAETRQKVIDWIEAVRMEEARRNAGDPGPVVLRRLNNAEYNYTVSDLTGVELNPTREFPTDSAAGEGFTNTGNALVMSPALLSKYLDAGKEVAAHAVLLPDRIRFSSSTTRGDWTNEILASIRETYARYSDTSGGTAVAT